MFAALGVTGGAIAGIAIGVGGMLAAAPAIGVLVAAALVYAIAGAIVGGGTGAVFGAMVGAVFGLFVRNPEKDCVPAAGQRPGVSSRRSPDPDRETVPDRSQGMAGRLEAERLQAGSVQYASR